MSNMKISQRLWHRFMLRVSCSCHTRTGAFYHSMPMIGDQALTRSRGCCVNVVQSPTAWKAKGDDYNRNPVGTGPTF